MAYAAHSMNQNIHSCSIPWLMGGVNSSSLSGSNISRTFDCPLVICVLIGCRGVIGEIWLDSCVRMLLWCWYELGGVIICPDIWLAVAKKLDPDEWFSCTMSRPSASETESRDERPFIINGLRTGWDRWRSWIYYTFTLPYRNGHGRLPANQDIMLLH